MSLAVVASPFTPSRGTAVGSTSKCSGNLQMKQPWCARGDLCGTARVVDLWSKRHPDAVRGSNCHLISYWTIAFAWDLCPGARRSKRSSWLSCNSFLRLHCLDLCKVLERSRSVSSVL
eukprot:5239949-Amphidinium_carterae.3